MDCVGVVQGSKRVGQCEHRHDSMQFFVPIGYICFVPQATLRIRQVPAALYSLRYIFDRHSNLINVMKNSVILLTGY